MSTPQAIAPIPAAPPPAVIDRAALAGFVDLCGAAAWRSRIAGLIGGAGAGARSARALQQQNAIELAIARLLRPGARPPSPAECRIAAMAGQMLRISQDLGGAGRARLRLLLAECLTGQRSLVPLFHMVRTAERQAGRGFSVAYAGLEDGAPFDLLLARGGAEAELACETVSAEDGRDLHRSAWFSLIDGIDPDLQTWLSAHPGRYLLKMTLPQGLRNGANAASSLDALADLQRRIRDMLARQARADQDEAAVLRLDPLLLAGSQASELGMMDALRSQFGPEAHLAVTRSGNGVLVMAARAGRENDVGAAMRRRMAHAAPARFTGSRPGILAMFLEDTDRTEWRALRDGLRLEGETRQFLTCPGAAALIAVTATSRIELFGIAGPDAAPDGELRFRNQAHPQAGSAALAPAVKSSV